MSEKIIDFSSNGVPPVITVVDEERRIHGAPKQSLTNMYSGSNGDFLSGIWSSEVGKWTVDYSFRHEFCYLIEGRVVLTNESGDEFVFKAGDAFTVPLGFKGSWEVVEPVTKYYAIYNHV